MQLTKAVILAGISVSQRSNTGPVSSPFSISIVQTPVLQSPASIARWMGAAPRHLGRRGHDHSNTQIWAGPESPVAIKVRKLPPQKYQPHGQPALHMAGSFSVSGQKQGTPFFSAAA